MNEAFVSCKTKEAEEQYKKDLTVLDIHFDTQIFARWLSKNIPLMHRVNHQTFQLPSTHNKLTVRKQNQSVI